MEPWLSRTILEVFVAVSLPAFVMGACAGAMIAGWRPF